MLAAREKELDQQTQLELCKAACDKTFWSAAEGLVQPSEMQVLKSGSYYFSQYAAQPEDANSKEELVTYLREACIDLSTALSKVFTSDAEGRLVEAALSQAELMIQVYPQSLAFLRQIPMQAWEAATTDRQNSEAAQSYARAQAQAAAAAAAAQISTVEETKANSLIPYATSGLAEVKAPSPDTLEPLETLGPLYDNGFFASLLRLARLLEKPDRTEIEAYRARRAVGILAAVLANGIEGEHPVHRHFFRWIATRLTTVTSGSEQLLYLGALKTLLPNKSLHFAFDKENVIYPLVQIMTGDTQTMQPLYLVGYALWLLSYNPVNDALFHRLGIVPRAAALIRTVKREKVVRIHLALFVNLVKRSTFTEELIGADFHRYIPLIRTRNYKDADIAADLDTLETVLNQRLSELSSFEMYVAELQAGTLRKSPVHNEKFWRENFLRFEDDKYAMIKAIIAQLDSEDPVAVEVACYDLGEFARFHPDGKRVLTKLEAKTKLMLLMSSPEPAIAKAALLAVQKLMVQKWDQMVASGAAGGSSGSGAASPPAAENPASPRK